MSRIGKQPITIPDNVELKIDDTNINVKGPKGNLNQILSDKLEFVYDKEKKG